VTDPQIRGIWGSTIVFLQVTAPVEVQVLKSLHPVKYKQNKISPGRQGRP